MIELNETNGASFFTHLYAKKALELFKDNLVGAEFGIAYGGGVEKIGHLWKGKGIIYGFDTFEGHPKEIGELCPYTLPTGGRHSFAATCMDNWYKPEHYGMDALKLDYMQAELDKQNLSNVKLVKGLITEKTDLSFINHLHYCLLDLDFPLSMEDAYRLVKDKIVQGGFLLLHDVIPKGQITGCYEVYQDIMKEGIWELVEQSEASLIVILKRK